MELSSTISILLDFFRLKMQSFRSKNMPLCCGQWRSQRLAQHAIEYFAFFFTFQDQKFNQAGASDVFGSLAGSSQFSIATFGQLLYKNQVSTHFKMNIVSRQISFLIVGFLGTTVRLLFVVLPPAQHTH